jgi:hypothetical protein
MAQGSLPKMILFKIKNNFTGTSIALAKLCAHLEVHPLFEWNNKIICFYKIIKLLAKLYYVGSKLI